MTTTRRCPHCPIPADLACQGERAARLCRLVDPADALHDPGYLPSLWALARRVADRPAPPDLAETIRLLASMGACPFRAVDAGCGCSGAKCSLRAGGWVSHLDCFPCLRRYGYSDGTSPRAK
jgi:hypothetical protein